MTHPTRNLIFRPGSLFWLSTTLAGIVIAGCGGTDRKVQNYNAPDAGAANASGGNSGSPGAGGAGAIHGMERTQTIGTGTQDCVPSSGGARLQMLPERATAFSFSGATHCESLGTSLLLKNTNTESIHISGLSVAPADFALGAQLPIELEVGATLLVAFSYSGTNRDGADGTLTVATSVGCFDFRVRGLAGDDRVMTYTHRAIDFGVVPTGVISEPHTVSILFQFASDLSPPTVQGFSSSPEELFEIVTRPGVTQPASCDMLQVAVRFKAPATVGEHEGGLMWRVSTDSAEGTVLIPLYATSR